MVAVFVPVLSKANCSSQSWWRPEGEGWDRLSLPTKKTLKSSAALYHAACKMMRLKGRIVNVRCEAEVPINKQPLHRKFFADFNQEFSIVTPCSCS